MDVGSSQVRLWAIRAAFLATGSASTQDYREPPSGRGQQARQECLQHLLGTKSAAEVGPAAVPRPRFSFQGKLTDLTGECTKSPSPGYWRRAFLLVPVNARWAIQDRMAPLGANA